MFDFFKLIILQYINAVNLKQKKSFCGVMTVCLDENTMYKNSISF